ncbi:MAG: hypothetical protein A2136_01070 [Chloroflexi bacterium RBG_16_54_11]|nr:MAG: hypothetical protein A2136_01070 [Chloroflexi bacterium RBG_16_54_11]
MSRSIVIPILVILLVLGACTGSKVTSTPVEVVGKPVQVEGGAYTDVSVVELQSMLENKDFTFVNVHIPFEGDIAGTDLSIPYDQVAQNLDELRGKEAKIVLYCRSGRMSDIAARELVGLGYTNIWNLAGGMVAWEAAGLAIER